ncbi:MAG TPA: bifunctional UDP-3-O-[3-hydroxymyristoyl] N-acetylglucosamine deacetylase/3-hydroxyacyl-ACP dehydratase [Gemmatimonadales bacterium]|nr:bifunctional UDP-3-O-[3-hydroxymyristoyl] N-acetylglucosamine deacetylase/3-hydroxyacyl-ACP dehydratase [Gemmatimonadales bacterium]
MGSSPRSSPLRRTLRRAVSLEGVGIHTGARTRVTFHPAESGAGIVFRRTDLDGSPCIPARLSSVTGVERRTTLARDGAEIHTVEHVLAAVYGLGVDDVLIDLTGPEPPVLDGSFQPFVEALRQAEPVEEGSEAVLLTVTEPFTVTEGEARYLVGPAPQLKLSVMIEFPHPLIGRQTGSYDVTPDGFAAELAPARTFGFMHEVEALRKKGLIVGASVENAVVLDDAGLVGSTLRWPDEFVRHKAADIVGDLALLGGRLKAHVVAERPSHRGNVALGNAISRRAALAGRPPLDIRHVLDVLPHRYPMLLVDRIIEIEDGRRIVGIKNVTINEPFFEGHFPGHPVMPGVLIIEAMAQVGGVLLMGHSGGDVDLREKVVYFMSLDAVKFRRPVVPGDQIRFELELIQHKERASRMRGVGYVDGHVVVEAEMMARVVDK